MEIGCSSRNSFRYLFSDFFNLQFENRRVCFLRLSQTRFSYSFCSGRSISLSMLVKSLFRRFAWPEEFLQSRLRRINLLRMKAMVLLTHFWSVLSALASHSLYGVEIAFYFHAFIDDYPLTWKYERWRKFFWPVSSCASGITRLGPSSALMILH